MPFSCPTCKSPVEIPQIPIREGIDIFCGKCNTKLRIEITLVPIGSQAPPPVETAALNPELVLVAVIGEVTEEMMIEVLAESGFKHVTAMTAEQILERMEKDRPCLAILDVGLQGVFDRIIPAAKKSGTDADMKVILLSSIHNQARYKREPDSLYGADDYIERHHIEDQLILKMHKALGRKLPAQPETQKSVSIEKTPAPAAAPPVRPPEPAEPPRAARAPVPPPAAPPAVPPAPSEPPAAREASPATEPKRAAMPAGDLSEHDAAKRLARLIISDIALYNQKQVEEGVKSGTLNDVLRDELDEGMKLYQSRTSKTLLDSTNYFEEAVNDFIEKQRARFSA